jgi:hypothetical protein
MDRTGRDAASVDQVHSATAQQNAQAPPRSDSIGETAANPGADAEQMIRWETEGGALNRFSQPG